MTTVRLLSTAAVAALAAAVAGCGVSDPYNDHQTTTATKAPAARTTSTIAGVVPPPSGYATTPEQAIARVALAWGNWTSATLHAQHVEAIELTADSAAHTLKEENAQIEDGIVSTPTDVRSRATVESLTLRPGTDRRDALLVTHEELSGLGPLGSNKEYVVTLTTVQRRGVNWIVTRWERQS